MHPRLLAAAGMLLAAACVTAHAACDTGLAERMHAQLHPERPLDHRLAVCEPRRGFARQFIVVLPLPRPSSIAGFTPFDLDVLVVEQADNGNTERARIMSRLFEPSALREYDVRLGAIRVDSARYDLARGVHAFGLRVARQGTSRDQPYADETLSLYVPRGAAIVKVLDGLQVLLERGEWDAGCTGRFDIVRGSLTVARGASHGHADLLLRSSRSQTRSVPEGETCVTREQLATSTTTTLRYDGQRYALPPADVTQ